MSRPAAPRRPAAARPLALIVWAYPELEASALDLLPAAAGEARFDVGGCSTLEQDSEVIAAVSRLLAATAAEHKVVVLVVKGWEPPLGELTDFIEELRDAVGPEPTLRLLPVARGIEATAAEWQEWSRYCTDSDDPRLSLMRPAGSGDGDESYPRLVDPHPGSLSDSVDRREGEPV